MTADARTRRRGWVWAVSIAVVIVMAALAWIGFRMLAAAESLQRAADSGRALQSAVLEGGSEPDELTAMTERVLAHADAARAHTHDPVWAVVEHTPFLGANLRALRTTAEALDELAVGGIPPLMEAAATLQNGTLSISTYRISSGPLISAAVDLSRAHTAFSDVSGRVNAIDTDPLLPPVRDLVARLGDHAAAGARAAGALEAAAEVLPAMLGGTEPRNHLVLLQSNAVVRATGGAPVAALLVRAQDGVLSIARVAAARDLPPLDEPVVELDPAVLDLFDDAPARSIQSAFAPAPFPTAASLAAAQWTARFGDVVDGVVAIDAVAVDALIGALGPQTVGAYTLDAGSTADVLVAGIPLDAPGPTERGAAYTAIAAHLFASALTGSADTAALLGALDEAAVEHRVHVWSAHPSEQVLIERSTVAGVLPRDRADVATVGVFVNDRTGGAMGVYTSASVLVETARCADGGAIRVTAAWSNGAPADAAESLPEGVTGSGRETEPGSVRTRIAIYGPERWEAGAALPDDAASDPRQTVDGTRPVTQREIVVPAGGTREVVAEFTGPRALDAVDLRATPLLEDPAVEVREVGCWLD